MRIFAADFVRTTARSITPEGFLVAPGTIATSDNVQKYSASELGLTGYPADAMVGLYRPTDEVMSPETLASFENKPISLNHPPGSVSAANWKDFAVGDVRDVKASGKDMIAVLTIRDSKAVQRVLLGKTALSCGYSFDLDLTPGVASDGTSYVGIQRKIRGNHTAIVDVARGGPRCRIADQKEKESDMNVMEFLKNNAPAGAVNAPLAGRALQKERLRNPACAADAKPTQGELAQEVAWSWNHNGSAHTSRQQGVPDLAAEAREEMGRRMQAQYDAQTRALLGGMRGGGRLDVAKADGTVGHVPDNRRGAR